MRGFRYLVWGSSSLPSYTTFLDAVVLHWYIDMNKRQQSCWNGNYYWHFLQSGSRTVGLSCPWSTAMGEVRDCPVSPNDFCFLLHTFTQQPPIWWSVTCSGIPNYPSKTAFFCVYISHLVLPFLPSFIPSSFSRSCSSLVYFSLLP